MYTDIYVWACIYIYIYVHRPKQYLGCSRRSGGRACRLASDWLAASCERRLSRSACGQAREVWSSGFADCLECQLGPLRFDDLLLARARMCQAMPGWHSQGLQVNDALAQALGHSALAKQKKEMESNSMQQR